MNYTLSRPQITKIAPIAAIIVALMLMLTACSGGAESVTKYTKSEGGIENTITYYANGDEVTKQISESVIDYEVAFGTTDVDQIKSVMDPITENFKGLDGVEYSFDYGETSATEVLSVDYSEAKATELAELPGSQFEGDIESNKISLKMSKEILEKSGYEEVK